MIRAACVLLAMVLLLGLGYLAGRLSGTATDGAQRARTLPGDDALEEAWEGFLGAQRTALAGLRASRFYVDDQERAEAYYAVLQDIHVAISGQPATHGDSVLLGTLPPPPDGAAAQLAPNRMAQRLEQAAQRLRARSEARLRLAAEAFAGDGGIEPDQAGMQFALHHWELDNEEALLVRFPAAPSASSGASLGNVWAMGLASALEDGGPGQRLDCTDDLHCRGILSHRDPGRPGWLDTGGHRRGVLVLRWRVGAPPPTTETLRFSDLQNRLDGPLNPDSPQPGAVD
jgi:hypothetical protein